MLTRAGVVRYTPLFYINQRGQGRGGRFGGSGARLYCCLSQGGPFGGWVIFSQQLNRSCVLLCCVSFVGFARPAQVGQELRQRTFHTHRLPCPHKWLYASLIHCSWLKWNRTPCSHQCRQHDP